MSRARPIGGLWFDTQQNGKACKVEHLELLAAAENISVDDLLDESLNQGELIRRLRIALGEGVIPAEVLDQMRLRKADAANQAQCRICDTHGWECEGSITRHHFVPRWLMLLLENYQAYAPRRTCTIPICIGRHRDLHARDDQPGKSIVQYLTDDERTFAQKMIQELEEQHPATFKLLAAGDETVYEAQLIRDYLSGGFTHQESKSVGVGSTRRSIGARTGG